MTYDVKCGGLVLVTTTDEEAARRIADALEAEREHLFQLEGVGFGVAKSNRDGEKAPAEAPKAEKPRAKRKKGGK